MGGLGKKVHIKLEKYINTVLMVFDKENNLVIDHIEVEELCQRRTVIFRNGYSYLCLVTDVDYTEYVHGPDSNESEPLIIHIPVEAIKPLFLNYLTCIETDRKQLRSKVEKYEVDSHDEGYNGFN